MITKLLKRVCLILSATIILFVFATSCNDSSSISIMSSLATSQPRDGKRWMNATFVYNSSDTSKVDAVTLLANDGLYIIKGETDTTSSSYLHTPTLPNRMKKANNDILINGLIRNVYVPSNYDSSTNSNIIIQSISSVLYEKSKYYKVNINDISSSAAIEAGISELTLDSSVPRFVAKTLSPNSDYYLFVEGDSAPYTYSIGKYIIDGNLIKLDIAKSFQSSSVISNFYITNDGNFDYMVFTSTVGDDIKNQTYFKRNLNETTDTELTKLKSLQIRNIYVYPDGKFMAFTQSGTVIHSESKKNYLYTADTNFNYNRYTPLVVFENYAKAGKQDDEPDLVFFGKYGSNGFIITGYNKELSDKNKVYNSNYSSTVQTQGYAETLRSESISDLKGAILTCTTNPDYKYRILVLSVENGISTFLFKSCLPDQMSYRSDVIEARNKVELF